MPTVQLPPACRCGDTLHRIVTSDQREYWWCRRCLVLLPKIRAVA